jgi:ORF6N domain
MAKKEVIDLVAEQKILTKVLTIRGERVIMDKDLAVLYGIETKVFNQAVKRHLERFPRDFMFTLTSKEWNNLRSHFVTSSWGGSRYKPRVFTEQGVAMLSSILNSRVAIEVNIHIIRVFTNLRKFALTHKEILLQLAKLEKEVKGNSRDLENVFVVLKELIENQSTTSTRRRRIGFIQDSEEE